MEAALGSRPRSERDLREIEEEAERQVLGGKILVCGIHGEAHQRAAVVPLKWGSPRIVVMRGGFLTHLGQDLRKEPFQEARLWRYEWDPSTDLAVSRRPPALSLPRSVHSRQVDRIIRALGIRTGSAAARFEDPLSLAFLMPTVTTLKAAARPEG